MPTAPLAHHPGRFPTANINHPGATPSRGSRRTALDAGRREGTRVRSRGPASPRTTPPRRRSPRRGTPSPRPRPAGRTP
eukprot:31198-Pelagococcus_subviridis.AAC.12